MQLTRRDFSRLGALGIAAHLAPSTSRPVKSECASRPKKIGYAVIGLGRIAGHFMPGTRSTTNSQITALVSGHRDKADRIAAEYNVPANSIYSYENFDEIAHNPAVDAVYVALPNSMHAEYTIRAAKAGKHVLCEKPMATNVPMREMIAACKAANVKLMIAYRCHYEPTNLRAVTHSRRRAGTGAGDPERIRLQYLSRRMAAQQEVSRRRSALRCRHLLAQRMPLSDRRRTRPHLRLCIRYRSRRPLQRSRRKCLLDHALPFRHRRQLHHHLRRQHGWILRVYGSKGWLQVDNAFVYEGLHLARRVLRQQTGRAQPRARPLAVPGRG